MKRFNLLLLTLLLPFNSYAYDKAIPFTSDYYPVCSKPEYLESRYYDPVARDKCYTLRISNYEVIEYRGNKVKITHKGHWTAWTYLDALIIYK